jgi:hypothetical protein
MKVDVNHGRLGVLCAAVLGASVAGCSGVVPLGNGAGDGGTPPGSGSLGGPEEEDGYGGPGSTTWIDTGAPDPDGGVVGVAPDASFVWSEDGGEPEDASYWIDTGAPDDAGVWIDTGTGDATSVAIDAGQCTLAISSGKYAEDPAACDACMAASCCDENAACAANSACVVTLTCAIVCETDGTSSSECVQCMSARASADPAYTELEQCMSNYCNLASEACFPLFP